MMKNKAIQTIVKLLILMLVASIYAFFFKIIVEGRGFLSTGVSGISVIISRLLGRTFGENLISIFYMFLYITLNLPLFFFAYKKISKKFLLCTMIYVLTFSVVVGFIPAEWAQVLQFDKLDDLTAAIVIGILSGLACSTTLIMGGCAGGIDIISTYLMVKKGRGIGVYNLIFNAVILSIGLIVSSIPAIIYTLVFAFFSSLVLDRYYNRNKKILLEIVTTKKDEICDYLLTHSHHGCTILKAEGAFTHEEKEVIHTVISWFQLKNMTKAIKAIDENCFIVDVNVYNVNGNFYMPPLK